MVKKAKEATKKKSSWVSITQLLLTSLVTAIITALSTALLTKYEINQSFEVWKKQQQELKTQNMTLI